MEKNIIQEFLNEVLGNHKQFNPNKHFYMTERKTHWSFRQWDVSDTLTLT